MKVISFLQFINESGFYLGKTKYTCCWGKYIKVVGGESEVITAEEYYKAKEEYGKSEANKKIGNDNKKQTKAKAKELAQFFHAVDSNPKLYKGREGKECYTFTQNHFHVFLYDKDGNHKILDQLEIEGNEKLIDKYMRRYGK